MGETETSYGNFQVKRFEQHDGVECGPAAVCAALSIYPEYTDTLSLEKIINAANIADSITTNGSNVQELTRAVEALTSGEKTIYFKRGGSIDELTAIITQNIPVIVDWQGSTLHDSVFLGQEGEFGHYSTVINVDNEQKKIMMIDSLPDFPDRREVSFEEFNSKWWDTDSMKDETGVIQDIRFERMFFLILPKQTDKKFLKKFNFKSGVQYFQTGEEHKDI